MRRRQSSASWDGEQTVDSAVTTSLASVCFSFTHRRRMDPTSGSHSETTSRCLKSPRFRFLRNMSSVGEGPDVYRQTVLYRL